MKLVSSQIAAMTRRTMARVPEIRPGYQRAATARAAIVRIPRSSRPMFFVIGGSGEREGERRWDPGLALRPRRPDDDRDVVAPSAVEGVLQQLFTRLLRGGHPLEPLGDPFVAHMLGEPVGAEEMDEVPLRLEAGDHRHRRLAPD